MATIFYADDDADDTFIFAQALKEINKDHNKNYELAIVGDGEQLLSSLQNPPPIPKIIFLDLNMPGMNGRDALKEIQKNEQFRQFPVVIFSTSSNKEDIDFTYNHGASLFINKPARYVDLKNLLGKCLAIDWKNYTRPTKEQFYLSAS